MDAPMLGYLPGGRRRPRGSQGAAALRRRQRARDKAAWRRNLIPPRITSRLSVPMLG
jgi:hypothetical protein